MRTPGFARFFLLVLMMDALGLAALIVAMLCAPPIGMLILVWLLYAHPLIGLACAPGALAWAGQQGAKGWTTRISWLSCAGCLAFLLGAVLACLFKSATSLTPAANVATVLVMLQIIRLYGGACLQLLLTVPLLFLANSSTERVSLVGAAATAATGLLLVQTLLTRPEANFWFNHSPLRETTPPAVAAAITLIYFVVSYGYLLSCGGTVQWLARRGQAD